MTINKYSFLLSMILILSACGDPVYNTSEELKPPKSVEGLTCLKKINEEESKCLNYCKQQRNNCIVKARADAEKLLPEKLEQYNRAIDIYGREIEIYASEQQAFHTENVSYLYELKAIRKRYSKEIKECKKSGGSFCDSDFKREISSFKRENALTKPTKPQKPEKPTLGSLAYTLHCTDSCGCKVKQRSSFFACGGKLITSKTCIDNCD